MFYETREERDAAYEQTMRLQALSDEQLNLNLGAIRSLAKVAAFESAQSYHIPTASGLRISKWAKQFLFWGTDFTFEGSTPTVWVTDLVATKDLDAQVESLLRLQEVMKSEGLGNLCLLKGMATSVELYHRAQISLESAESSVLVYSSAEAGMPFAIDKTVTGPFSQLWEKLVRVTSKDFTQSKLR